MLFPNTNIVCICIYVVYLSVSSLHNRFRGGTLSLHTVYAVTAANVNNHELRFAEVIYIIKSSGGGAEGPFPPGHSSGGPRPPSGPFALKITGHSPLNARPQLRWQPGPLPVGGPGPWKPSRMHFLVKKIRVNLKSTKIKLQYFF